MKNLIFAIGLLMSPVLAYSQIVKEKPSILEKAFDLKSFDATNNKYIGANWDEFGDLFFEKNGKQYWLATFTAITAPEFDYYRVFELVLDSGYTKEVTTSILGGYYKVEGPNPPYYYKDIDNDGIKDIFVFDHGKEYDTNTNNWKYFNIFFKGTTTGFVKTELPAITTVAGYYHGHDIGDFDKDGDNDIAIGINGIKIYNNNGSGVFTQMSLAPTSKYIMPPFSMKFLQADDDNYLELLAPPYRDINNSCCRAQTNLLNLENNATWSVSDFAQQLPFKNGFVSGSAQVLNFPSSTRKLDDLFFRVETFDTVAGFPQGRWLTKFYRNSPTKFDTILPVNFKFADTANFFYIDPKASDINFDGYADIFFKENMYYTGSPFQHKINERLWMNDGNNNFNPINFKFNDEANKAMYLFVKSDTTKKYSLFMSLTETWIDSKKYIYNRFDSLIFPIKEKQTVEVCQDQSVTNLVSRVPVKIKLIQQPKFGLLNLTDSSLKYKATNFGTDTIRYRFYNDFFESTDFEIVYFNKKNPVGPILSKDSSNFLVSNLPVSVWFKDGIAIADTLQKFKPTSSGLYTAKTTSSGCLSELSAPYYYFITAISQLGKEEFIKITPNPFYNQINLSFNMKGYQSLNLDVYDIATGNLLSSRKGLSNGASVLLDKIPSGTYLIKVYSTDNKSVHQFKVIKI